MMLIRSLAYPINTIIAIPESVLLIMTAFFCLCIIMINRINSNHERSVIQKALSRGVFYLIQKRLIVEFAASRLKLHIETKKS